MKLIWRDYAGQRKEHAELKEAHRWEKNYFYVLLSSVDKCDDGHSEHFVNNSTGPPSEP